MLTETLRGVFLKNLHLKILSLFLSLLMWVYVVGEQRSEYTMTIPLRPEVSPSVSLSVGTPENIQVTFRGPRYILTNLLKNPPEVAIPLYGVDPEPQLRAITPSMIAVPYPIEVVKIDPSEVMIYLEARSASEIPIRPVFKDTLPPGYRMEGTPEVVPATVTVEGPASQVNAAESILTEAITPEAASGVQQHFVKLQPREFLSFDTEGNVMVRFTVTVSEKDLVLSGVPVRVSPGLAANPAAVEVTLHGPVTALAGLGPSAVMVSGPYPTGSNELLRVAPLVIAPDSTTIVSVSPSEITIGPADRIPQGE